MLTDRVQWVKSTVDLGGVKAALWLLDVLRESPPRVVSSTSRRRPVLLFTDGAYEGGISSAGAVIIDPETGFREYFGLVLPSALTGEWMSLGSKQPIALVELLPVAMAKVLWSEQLRDRSVIAFVDNNAVLFQLISGTCRNVFARDILLGVAKQDVANRSRTWYARVPSPGNVADSPSRMEFAEVEGKFNCKQTSSDVLALCCLCSARLSLSA